MSNSALVTGATGFIGQHLVRRLLDQNWQVRVLCRPQSQFAFIDSSQLDIVPGDVRDAADVARATAGPLTAVFHLAANTSTEAADAQLQQQINVDGTRHVIDALRATPATRLVHTSSVSVHGFSDRVINEHSPLDPAVNWIGYCRTKALAEQLVRVAIDDGLNAVIVSPSHVMGPWDSHNWIRMIRMIDQQSLPGIPPGSGSFADVREVAKAFEAAALRGDSGRKYLLGGPHASFEQLVMLLAEALDRPVTARPMPAWLMRAVARIRQLTAKVSGRKAELTPQATAFVCGHEYCDSSAAIEVLGYRETPLRQLVSDTVEWYRSHPQGA